MSYIVTEYKKENKGKVFLCLNEEIRLWLYAGEIRQLSLSSVCFSEHRGISGEYFLKEGMELSEEQYQHILHEIIGKRVTKRAMHLLEKQDRTEHQLWEKLLQNEYPKEAIEDAISYVKKYHYLDDKRYARTFIRIHQEKRSRMRLRNDLLRRGISKDVIEFSMEEEFSCDEKEQIRSLLEKKNFSTDTADRKELGKMYQFLMRRGFRSSDISEVLKTWEEF